MTHHYDFGNTSSWGGGASDATIYDLSGNGNNAAFTSTGYTKNTDNGGSIVLAADTQNSRFDLASAVTYSNTQDFTLFVGYKYISTPSGWNVYFGNNDSDNFVGRQGNSYFRMQDESNNNIDISGSTGGGAGMIDRDTEITVFYAVKDDKTAYFYENGRLSNGGETNASFGDITISGNQYQGSYGTVPFPEQRVYFWGIYNRALTADEIAANYVKHQNRLGI